MRRTRTIWVAGLLLAVTVTVGACTDSSGSASGGSATGLGEKASTAAGGSARPAPGAAPPAKSSLTSAQLGSAAKIRTATMTVAVTGAGNVAAKADRADTLAVQAGGEVDADSRSGGKTASATLVLRVPPAALPGTLTALSQLGTEKARQLSTTDVTGQVADVDSRVASASAAIARLRDLYTRATKVSDVIAIESELSQREADLESLQAQQRALAGETSMATITLSLVTAAVPAAKHHQTGGFTSGLRHGWHGFVAAAGWLAGALGTALPFLVLVALLGAGALAVTRGRRPRPGNGRSPRAS